MSKSGNDLWKSQIQSMLDDMDGEVHCKEAENELFTKLYMRMVKDGMTQGEIREHFTTTFGIKYTAFYTRLRKVGMKYVI